MSDTPKHIKKRFALSSWAVDNSTTVMVLSVLIALAGMFSYITMPREAFPEISSPQIFIATAYPGSSPTDVEKLVTKPLEDELNRLQDLKKLTSTSVQGFSFIVVEFTFDVNTTEGLRRVKDKVDVAVSDSEWPRDLPSEPTLIEFSLSELLPVLNVNLSGDFTVDQLNEYAKDLKDDIERIQSISKVEIRGAKDREVEIAVDLPKMESLQISFSDIESAIQQENIDASAGEFKEGTMRRSIRVIGQYTDVDQIRNTIVKREKQETVYLKDIATVEFKQPEATSYARKNGNPVVMLDVMKRNGENIITTTDQITNVVKEAQKKYLPQTVEISITNDTSISVNNMVADLQNSIFMGMILVVVVLMFFLGFRNALFVGIAIPMSMLLSFAVLSMMGVTLNNIVLFSLVMALGMLVDNGIVVVENIYRLMHNEGYKAIEATKQGVGEVAWPIIASTATTLAAFLPLAFWPGIMGEFMFWLPMTIIVVLLSSLFVALVITPMLTAGYMRSSVKKEKIVSSKDLRKTSIVFGVIAVVTGIIGWPYEKTFFIAISNLSITYIIIGWFYKFALEPGAYWFQNDFMVRMEVQYERLLTFALRGKNALKFFLGTVGMLFLSFIIFGIFSPKVIFFPDGEPTQFYVYSSEPIGTDIEVTDSILRGMEIKVNEVFDNYVVTENVDGKDSTFNFMVKSVIAQSGEGADNTDNGPSLGEIPHKAKITVEFVESKYRRGISTNDILNDVRQALDGIPGANIVVNKAEQGPPAGLPINIELQGDDYQQLIATSTDYISFINSLNIPGIEELTMDIEQGKPEMPIIIDREKARRLNISTSQIADALRTSLYGKEVSTYKIEEDDYKINVRLAPEYRYDEAFLLSQKITFRDPATGKISQVPISSVAKAEKTSTYSAIKRIDQARVITVKSNVIEGYNANEIVNKIKAETSNFNNPNDVSISFTGEQEDMAENMEFLSSALIFAVLLIFLIMVAQFNSASLPFIIITTVGLSMIGVLMGLVIFRMDFVVVMTMIGIISLAGVVVNNGIVLVDCAKLDIEESQMKLGLPKDQLPSMHIIYESIVLAGKTRLRPVLLTAITTILGLVPLAIGFNFDFITLFTELNPHIFIGGDNVQMWGPIAWTIIFGLTFATFLTLIIVPVMLDLLYSIKIKQQKKRMDKEAANS